MTNLDIARRACWPEPDRDFRPAELLVINAKRLILGEMLS